ncbi:16S rRNA (guanine(527)-N(7))-methyltransferase RsmG [Pararhodobacter sp.]|uniref:16S rRNA (guanine(527)-N(7))-methyltransferase RsmG n=1 Tax=Pararhodobacter sp. TaxID=2127056 RepID=UPI002AFF3703|nr:16S rRNA (guanine(527)-N(7))-methyltransferase RsmG [Pararhodobacter sp.]
MRQLDERQGLECLRVSRETIDDLRSFAEDLATWSKSINLVAPNSLVDVWNRHVLDSAQLVNLSPGPGPKWCDLGSGGGLPGLVVAILLREISPETSVTLIESDARKAAFLKLKSQKYSLNVSVVRARIDEAERCDANVVSARALAPLELLLPLVFRHVSSNGTALLHKGRNFEAEVEQARRSWHFNAEALESVVDTASRILRVTNIKPKGVIE